jgi:nitrite reductase/ring-hydroxylating ferredoxin subunit
MALVTVATLSELTPGRGKLIEINGRKIALFQDGAQVYAIEDTCPHRGASLSEGVSVGGQVTCPWHSARFDLTTGANLCPPAQTGVKVFPVHVAGADIQIDV